MRHLLLEKSLKQLYSITILSIEEFETGPLVWAVASPGLGQDCGQCTQSDHWRTQTDTWGPTHYHWPDPLLWNKCFHSGYDG